MAPAQLYSTTSGRLYHAGKILVVTVGLPARGKTHIAVAMTRYLRWMGVKTQPFHLGDYRRKVLGPGAELPEDYFFVKAGASTVKLRQRVVAACKEDVYRFLEQEGGQVAIYDAVNPLAGGRINLKKEFEKRGIQVRDSQNWVRGSVLLRADNFRRSLSNPSAMTRGSSRRTYETSRFPAPTTLDGTPMLPSRITFTESTPKSHISRQ